VDTFIPLFDRQATTGPFEREFAGCAPVDQSADYYDTLLARLRSEHVPYSVLWELTHKCNLKCVMCYNDPLSQPELSTDECLTILAQLVEAGTLRLTLTGGEILTRPDFFEIALEARELGFALDLKTNGTLITPEAARRIASLAPLQVDISLLGACPETFDLIAGVSRTLERVLRGVRLLQDHGVRVKLNTLLMDLNLSERYAMVDLANRLGVYYEQVLKISPSDTGDVRAQRLQLSGEQMAQAMIADQTPFTRHERLAESRTCSVGLSSCLISPYGVVYPCIELRILAGDLRRQSFLDIWRNASVLTELRESHVQRNLPDCCACPIQPYCEGRCAGIAWKDHGDLYGGHMLACWQALARYSQQHLGEAISTTPLLEKAAGRIVDPAIVPSCQSVSLVDGQSTPGPLSGS
jgi:radical SAM protein with 4Fe4S-binding SPASM domain